MHLPFETAYVAASVVDTVLAGKGEGDLRRFSKPVLMPLLIASQDHPSANVKAALIASWSGDVALLAGGKPGLMGGIAGFAVAHAAYLREISTTSAAQPGSHPGVTFAYATGLAGAGTALWRRLEAVDERQLRIPVLLYGALVSAMGRAATSRGLDRGGEAGLALAVGGALFVISDGLVALSKFGRPRRTVDAAVMATYTAAQWLLVRGLRTD